MEFIICDKYKMETRPFPDAASMDFDIGDLNDVQITCKKGVLDFGMYLICPGTEYGALMEETDTWTNDAEETWHGNSFRRFLQQFIIEPPAGEDYLTVSGDAHNVMARVLNDKFDSLFTVQEEPSGIDVGTYKFNRYTNALDGFTKMLERKDARIHIEIRQGGSNEPFSVILSAVPIQNLSKEIEYSQDSKVAVNIKESRRGINHLICLGKGDLKDRQVVHLYAQPDGSVLQNKKYYTGMQERTAVYDYSNAESLDDLIGRGSEELKKLMNSKHMEMKAQEMDLQIGDIIAGRNYDTGLYLAKPIVKKIVKVQGGTIDIEYKVEGES